MIARTPLNIVNYFYSSTLTTTAVNSMCYDSTRSKIVVLDGVSNTASPRTIRILDLSTLTENASSVIGSIILNVISYDSVSDNYYVGYDTSAASNQAYLKVSASSLSVISTISHSTNNVRTSRGISIDHIHDKIFISDSTSNVVYVFKYSDDTFITSFSVPRAVGTYVDESVNELYVAGLGNAEVYVYSTIDYSLIRTITGIGDLALTDVYTIFKDENDSDILLFSCRNNSSIALYRKSTNVVFGKFNGLQVPIYGVSKGSYVYAVQQNLNKVSIISKFY